MLSSRSLLLTLSKKSVVLFSLLLSLGVTLNIESLLLALALETSRGDKTLDLGSLGVGLLALLLNTAVNDELANIVLLGESEDLADLGSTLGAKAAGVGDVGKTLDVLLTLLDDDEVKNRKISGDDATTDGLALALTTLALAVAGRASLKEKADTARSEDTLLHGETLKIVTTGNLEDVTLPVITKDVTLNLVGHTLVDESTDNALILNLEDLLGSRGGVCNVKL